LERIEDLEDCVGKTVKKIKLKKVEDHFGVEKAVLRIEFTDGSFIEFESWDYEGYMSGIAIRRR